MQWWVPLRLVVSVFQYGELDLWYSELDPSSAKLRCAPRCPLALWVGLVGFGGRVGGTVGWALPFLSDGLGEGLPIGWERSPMVWFVGGGRGSGELVRQINTKLILVAFISQFGVIWLYMLVG